LPAQLRQRVRSPNNAACSDMTPPSSRRRTSARLKDAGQRVDRD
jgi:hypothetical protein